MGQMGKEGLSGEEIVADDDNLRVQVFDPQGRFLRKWEAVGSGDDQFLHLRGLALDREGNFYMADGYNGRVRVFDSEGQFLHEWGSEGSGEGQLETPSRLALDREGNVYVLGRGTHRMQVFKRVISIPAR